MNVELWTPLFASTRSPLNYSNSNGVAIDFALRFTLHHESGREPGLYGSSIAVPPPGLRPHDSVRNMPSQPVLNHPS